MYPDPLTVCVVCPRTPRKQIVIATLESQALEHGIMMTLPGRCGETKKKKNNQEQGKVDGSREGTGASSNLVALECDASRP